MYNTITFNQTQQTVIWGNTIIEWTSESKSNKTYSSIYMKNEVNKAMFVKEWLKGFIFKI